ncbi:TIGR03620 family F420-dependent LLM class oxidoreductase [Pedococcus sp. KACC 23699]|uniref:TIGR03620 family F420-dependent LLM class oxidoreductase n=1 Tax=Pedococcus sp. KACC 23699 TaxID=3149228 RepID=A0AAU7JVR3_9MICO
MGEAQAPGPPLGPVGIWAMELRSPSPQTLEAVSALDDMGTQAMWVPGLDGHDVLNDVDALLTAAPNATVALGVLSIWSQTAEQLGTRLSSLDRRHGPRALVGLGVSNPHAAALAGRSYGTPTESMRAYLEELDGIPDAVPVHRRILGALGPRMVDVAAAHSAGWHPFLVPPAYVHRERRRLGPMPIIAPHQAVVLDTDAATARAVARAGVGMYIGFPAYRSNLARLGFTEADLVSGGSDRLIDALVAHGSVDDVAARVREHLDAGADHVALHVLSSDPQVRGGPGGQAPVAEWKELAPLLTEQGGRVVRHH